ncbi:hypothetical protein J9874_04073 (plasmid) [Duffyella gerundensis]|nr:hypothetical protein J9874_04073 [Duffyella gerundensis]
MANMFSEKSLLNEICSERCKKDIIRVKGEGMLLTKSELKAYQIFEIAMQSDEKDKESIDCMLFSQVHLFQIFTVNDKVIREYMDEVNMTIWNRRKAPDLIKKFWDNQMGRKSIDLLVCDRKRSKVICGVEIDGESHEDDNQIKYDEIKNFLFKSAGIPLIRFTNDEIDSLYKRIMHKEYLVAVVQTSYNSALKDVEYFHQNVNSAER